jgi:hypothetical protein
MLTRRTPGTLLGLVVVAGTVTAALAVRPRAGRMILPVPALSYLVGALISGIVYSRSAASSGTVLAIGAAQWVANGFFPMVLATVLAAAIVVARWYLWRRRRPARRDQDRTVPPGASPHRRRAAFQTSAEPGYPAGFAGPGGAPDAADTGGPGDPWGRRDWGDTGPRGSGRRPGPRPGTGPYNFSSGA